MAEALKRRRRMRLAAILATFLSIASVPISFGQNLSVKTGKNEMDNEAWVRIELKADESYRSRSGNEILPLIEIQCSEAPNSASIGVFFYTGIIETDSKVRVKFGEAEPTINVLYGVLADRETLQYVDLFDKPTEFAKLKPSQFAVGMSGYKTARVEFVPHLSPGRVVAKFDLTSLQPEIVKHPECVNLILKERSR